MRDLVDYIAKSLVDNADAVSIEEFKERGNTVYELRVSPDEVGRVIGREGKVANAIRTLLRAAGAKQRIRAVLEIGD